MRFVGLIIALVLALGAGLVAWKLAGGSQPAVNQVVANPSQPDFQTVDVLVAAKPIPIGEKIEAAMLDTQQWPSHLVVDGFVTTADQSKKIVGMVTRSPFQEREPILLSKLANPDDPSFLAAGLPKGKKVVTISTDAIAGVAGFIYPGDRVDVLVTHPLPRPDAPEGARGKDAEETVTETLLSNIKVLAVDQRATGGDEKNKKPTPSSVSLEVTLEEAQRLRLAQETGYLSMTLRSLHDKDVVDTGIVTHVKDVTLTKAYEDGGAGNKKKDSVFVVRGTRVEEMKIAAPVPAEAAGDVSAEAASVAEDKKTSLKRSASRAEDAKLQEEMNKSDSVVPVAKPQVR